MKSSRNNKHTCTESVALFLFFNAAAFLLTAGTPAAKQIFKGLNGRMFPIWRGAEECYASKLWTTRFH